MFNIIPSDKQIVIQTGNQLIRCVRVKDANELFQEKIEELGSKYSAAEKLGAIMAERVIEEEQQNYSFIKRIESQRLELSDSIKTINNLTAKYEWEIEEKKALIKNWREKCSRLDSRLSVVINQNKNLANRASSYDKERLLHNKALVEIQKLKNELEKIKQESISKDRTIERLSSDNEELKKDNAELKKQIRLKDFGHQMMKRAISQKEKEIEDLRAAYLILSNRKNGEESREASEEPGREEEKIEE